MRLWYRKLSFKFGIQIPYYADIGGGFKINHYSGIVISGDVHIGENFNIRNNTTIGKSNGKVPRIGNNVTVGSGAIIIGGITIGDNVTIGAGSVCTKDIKDNVIVAGNPARVIEDNDETHTRF
jgi:serine O-acetyltransferase